MMGFEAKVPPGEGRSPGTFHLVRFEREIFPFLQSSQWVPRTGVDERDRLAGAYDVVFDPDVLERIRKEAERGAEADVVGLLLGRGCECPWTRRHWVHVTGILMPAGPSPRRWFRRRKPVPDRRPIEERLNDLLARDDRPEGHVVGWYRGRPDRAPALTPDEAAVHSRSFPEPWQLAVLIPTRAEAPTLGVLGRDEGGELRPYLLRTFYRLEERRPRRNVVATNYRKVDRVTSAPGRTRLAIEVQHRKAPALATTACTVLGVLIGLGLSYELSRASQPGGYLAGGALEFAAPGEEPAPSPEERVAREAAEAATAVPGLAAAFEDRVAAYEAQRLRPATAAGYCRDLQAAFDGVHGAYVNLIRERARITEGTAQDVITAATREKGAVDVHFDASGCR